jgi:NOL1/NOP2/fmu family ribosome biogenesis protein|tara:strand:- start:829 stop:1299 length:471 start_codon:yes stop_codon:yes gene_type:complete
MNSLKIFSQKEKTKLVEQLNKQFGIKNVEGIFSMRGRERLFLLQGSFRIKQVKELESTIPVERVGIYFGKFMDNKIRLSIEGVHLLKDQIKKNVFELNDEQLKLWMKGNELNIKTGKNDLLIMKYKDNLLGCGKASAEKITNFIPKNRRLRERNAN